MYIDLSIFAPYVPLLPVLLPLVVTFIAGLLRQDGLPKQANEGITITLVLAASVVSALYDKALSNNALLDFVVVVGYMTAIIRLPAMQDLQQYLQSNWLNVLKSAAGAAAQDNKPTQPALPALTPAQVSVLSKPPSSITLTPRQSTQTTQSTQSPPNRLTGG